MTLLLVYSEPPASFYYGLRQKWKTEENHEERDYSQRSGRDSDQAPTTD
jgi:hypothetical protein